MYPELLKLGPITVYTYGVLLAAAYLLGLKLAMTRAKSRGLDPNRALDLGIAIIVAALVGAKLLLILVDFDKFRQNPGRDPFHRPSRRRLLWRAHRRRRGGVLVHVAASHAALDHV